MYFPTVQIPFAGSSGALAFIMTVASVLVHGLGVGALSISVGIQILGQTKQSEEWEIFSHRLARIILLLITAIGLPAAAGFLLFSTVSLPRGATFFAAFFFPQLMLLCLFILLQSIFLLIYVRAGEPLSSHRKVQTFFGLASITAGAAGAASAAWTINAAFFGASPTDTSSPGFLSHMALRLLISLLAGSAFATIYLLFTRWSPGFKEEALRFIGTVTAGSTLLIIPVTWWYAASIDSPFKPFVFSGTPALRDPSFVAFGVTATLTTILLQAQLARKGFATAVKGLAVPSFILLGAFSFIHEQATATMAGPYLIRGMVHRNQLMLAEEALMREQGITAAQASMLFPSTDFAVRGESIFHKACASCHPLRGPGGIASAFHGRSEESIEVTILRLNAIYPFMPPFSGTAEDRRILAAYLYRTFSVKAPRAISGNEAGAEGNAP